MLGIDRALNDGLTLNQDSSTASSQGVSWGTGAQQLLRTRPESAFISQYGGNEATFANSGIGGS